MATIIIEVPASGPYRVEGAPIADAMLESYLRTLVNARSTRAASIVSHSSVQYARVVGVMDIARRAGLTEISLTATP